MTFLDLTIEEIRIAAHAGIECRLAAIERGRVGQISRREDAEWEVNITGTLGEFAVAKLLGAVFDPGLELDAEGDLRIPGLQVRSTGHRNGKLIVYESDPDEHKYVLVRGGAPRLEVAGWLSGAECKQPGFWNAQAREPSFWVGAEHLRPVPDRRGVGSEP